MSSSQTQAATGLTPIAFEILFSLARGPQHGYGIKLDIEERTAGEISLGSGTLYQAIQRLERMGLIGEETTVDQMHDARRGRHYGLEPAGKTALEGELQRLNRVIEYARSHDLLSGPTASQ